MPTAVLVVGIEDGVSDGFAQKLGIPFATRLVVIEDLDEHEVGELLDDGKRIAHAVGPENVPDAVDLGLEFTSDHGRSVRRVSTVSLSHQRAQFFGKICAARL